MKRVIVASTNPVKIEAARAGFERMFPHEVFSFEGISVPSGVPDQPIGDRETYDGAKNRAVAASALHPDADFFVGLEGGIEEHPSGGMSAFAWMYVLDRAGKAGKGKTCTFFLPEQVADLIRSGMELGAADDQVFGMRNSKQSKGAVGILTGDVTSREQYYAEAMVMALVPFKNETLY